MRLFVGLLLATTALAEAQPGLYFQGKKAAKLTATCEDSGAGTQALTKTTFNGNELLEGGSSTTVHLFNVPTTCIDVPLEVPCTNHTAFHPKMWWCSMVGAQGNVTLGPFAASLELINASPDVYLGAQPLLECPMPAWDQIQEVTGIDDIYIDDASQTFEVQLVVKYGYTKETAATLPWVGVPGGDTLGLTMFHKPPESPPPPPPMPPAEPPEDYSCKAILDNGDSVGSGLYTIKPHTFDGDNTPVQVQCEMTRDGGGWTFGVKHWYQGNNNAAGRDGVSCTPGGGNGGGGTGACGSVSDALLAQGYAYKLSDAVINAVITGDDNVKKFDMMWDQIGYQHRYTSGNYEYITIKGYSGQDWTWASSVPASTNPSDVVFKSFRISDNALAYTWNMACGHVGGRGVNCYDSSGGPRGGQNCNINMGSWTGTTQLYMCNTNQDSYIYACNGAQHTSSYDHIAFNHRYWFRKSD